MQAAVKYAPCNEPVGDYLGYCLQEPDLKIRAATEAEAWELITELIADYQDSQKEVDKINRGFVDKWSIKKKR